MKKILFILTTSLVFSSAYCQNNPIDFENPGIGSSWTWTVFENDTNPPLEIVSNPAPGGVNLSSSVAKFTALQTGNPWAGCESMHGTDLGSFSFDSTNCVIKIMVFKDKISDVGIKFVDATSAAQPEIKVSNTIINEWEELTFDFSTRIGVYPLVKDQIVIFPDFDLAGRTDNVIAYFDNITFSSSSPSGPTSMAKEEIQQTTPLELFPMPASNRVRVNRNNCIDLQGEPIQIVSSVGVLVYDQLLRDCELDISGLANGLYYVRIGGKALPLAIGKLVVSDH